MKLRRFLAVSLAFVLLLSAFPLTALAAEAPERLSGANRYLTAVAISQAGWDKASTVVLARGDRYADAIAGVPLAYKLDAPILLTNSDVLHEATEAELERLEARKVVILGGTAAVSQAVEDYLKGLELEVERVRGANRQGTAAEIASILAPNGVDTAVIAYSENFPDALAAASYAAVAGYPILLTDKDSLPKVTADALIGLQVAKTIVVGGSGVIADAVLEQLPLPTRVNGANRYATSVALAEHFDVLADHYFIATGSDFADAITGSALAAKEGTGLLLVDNVLPESVAEFIVANKVKSVTILGGTGSVSDGVVRTIAELLSRNSSYTLTITGPCTIAIDEATEFTVTLKGDDTGVANIFGTLEYAITGGEGVLEYKDGETWRELPLEGHFGPKEGFAITPDWDQTTELRFTASEIASFAATVTLKEEGKELATETFEFATSAGVVAEEFAVARTEAINYYGYSVGFRLTDGLTPADVAAITVTLFQEETVLAINTATEALFGLDDLQHTSPFNVYADFEDYTEEYWNLGQWQGELLDVPTKAVIQVTLVDGRVIEVSNTNLTGDTSTILPKVWNADQKKAYATIQGAIDGAEEGSVIYAIGQFQEDLIINTADLTLQGDGVDSAEIAGTVQVNASDVTITGFTFTSYNPGAIIQVTGEADNATIAGNLFLSDATAMGIVLDTGTPSNITIQGNVFRFLHSAVYIHRGENVSIHNNYLTDIVEGAVSIETWAKNVAIEDNYLSFANALIYFWSEHYSDELVIEEEVIYSGNDYFMVAAEVALDKETDR